ncbi:MAG: NADH-quinone oxidoreductase subunit L [Pseudomonadota bacterium]|nr:NADH-quinone oxidoreductase subunit L [Pseudomonadota bacterium]
MLALIPALPLLGAIVNAVLNRRANRVVAGSIASAAVGASAILSFLTFFQVLGNHGVPVTQTLWTWMHVGTLNVDIGFSADPLSATMMCIITGIGFLIHVYSIGYMDDKEDARSVWRYFSYLNLFVFAMLLLVMGDSFPLMFVGWEGVGLCSYLLIGFWFTNTDYASAGKKAFITNRVGDFSFLIGLFWLFWALGDHATMNFAELSEVVAANPAILGGVGGLTVTAICLLFFGGATGKSAQIPLFVWLPDAMAGPTPVSALIHAATMVTSGIYMICRLSFLFVQAPAALAVIATIGALTAFFAATIAITQTDIKKVLAYSTVSQLGFMFLGVGVGAFTAGFFHVMTHAFFKALLFLGSGSIIHALHHEQDMRKMGGLRKHMKVTFAIFVVGWLAIIGFPGLSGFFSKDEILWLTFITPVFEGLPFGSVMPKVLWALAVTTALLTAFYMSRLMFMTFWGEYRGGHAHDAHGHGAHDDAAHGVDPHGAGAHGHAADAHGHGHAHTPHESPLVLTGPLLVLALLSAVGGLLNLPHWMPGAGWLHHFLEPVFEHAHVAFPEGNPLEFPLMGITLLGVAASVGLAYYLYVVAPAKPAEIAARLRPLYVGSLNKWFVDEIYDRVLLTPLVLFSRQILWAVVDAQIIDGAVNGAAAAATGLGRLHGRLVSGRVQAYALSIAAGAALIVTVYALGA